ncbi:hypothetical protein Hdeb2414_s0311g00864441 [Helianthus debilis subsp. tardiflorus]
MLLLSMCIAEFQYLGCYAAYLLRSAQSFSLLYKNQCDFYDRNRVIQRLKILPQLVIRTTMKIRISWRPKLTKPLKWFLVTTQQQITGPCFLQPLHHFFLLQGILDFVYKSWIENKILSTYSFTFIHKNGFYIHKHTVRYQPEREDDPQFNASVHGQRLMTISGVQNAEIPLNQIVIDTRDQEQDILLLRKHLADFSIKEAKIHNEKLALEKRIAYMRLAFDQQQKDLVDAAYKALSYRQEIIEENIRLTYALQDAQEERTTYIQSLMPLLAEYSLQPPVVDAQSIVSNVKVLPIRLQPFSLLIVVLFRHLQEKLIGIETKLKESQYQLTAWRSDVNPSSYAPSPLQSFGNKNGLELVPQQAYSDGQVPMSSDHLTARSWDVAGHSGGVADNLEPDSGRYSPLMNRNDHSLGTNAQVASHQGNSYPTSKNEEITNKQVTFSDPVSNNDDDFDEGNHNEGNEGEPFANWNSRKSSYTTTLEDPNSYSQYLSPVLEEPGSSFSEGNS